MSEDGIKVTDRRMFTPEGDLKEEYRFLEDEAKKSPPEPAASSVPPETEAPEAAGRKESEPAAGRREDTAGPRPEAERPPLEAPLPGPEGESSGFFDLLAVLSEPIPFYLGDATLPTGESGEDLHLARLYIDLLDVLRQKTAGNLTVPEANALEDLLYRLRLRYVQKRG